MKNLDKACGYRREAARNIRPGDRVFSAASRQQHEVYAVFSVKGRIILSWDGVHNGDEYGLKELVLVAV